MYRNGILITIHLFAVLTYIHTPFHCSLPYCASKIDATPKNPDAVRLLGFFVPIFHRAILIDAKRQKRRVDGI